jgi:Multicopper oxidase
MMKSLHCYIVLLSLFSISSSKLVREVLTLTWEEGAPDGQARDMVKMNGQFPGPQFYWDEGDDIEVGESMLFTNAIYVSFLSRLQHLSDPRP